MIRCSYPHCVLEEHDEGAHRFGRPEKPAGLLRLVQGFEGTCTNNRVPCDLCKANALVTPGCVSEVYRSTAVPIFRPAAQALYCDEFGFGWALCCACYTAHHLEVIKNHASETKPLGQPSQSDPPAPAVMPQRSGEKALRPLRPHPHPGKREKRMPHTVSLAQQKSASPAARSARVYSWPESKRPHRDPEAG